MTRGSRSPVRESGIEFEAMCVGSHAPRAPPGATGVYTTNLVLDGLTDGRALVVGECVPAVVDA
jgi:hypothetical protein